MLILPFFVVCNHADGHCDLGHALLDLALHVPAKSKGKIGVKIRFFISLCCSFLNEGEAIFSILVLQFCFETIGCWDSNPAVQGCKKEISALKGQGHTIFWSINST